MAIAFGGISTVSTSQTPTSVAVSGSNTIGYVYVVGDSSDNITAVTWGGVSMTKIGAALTPGDRYSSLWYVINPSSGGAIAFTGGAFWRSYSFYYTGAKSTGQPDSSNTGTVTSATSIAIATTVVARNSWTVVCSKDTTGGLTYTTSVGSIRVNADAGGMIISDSNGTIGMGSQSTTQTAGATVSIGAIAFSIASAVTTGIGLNTAGGVYARVSAASTKTQSFNNLSGDYLVVGFAANVDAPVVSSVTYGGVAMTQLTSATGAGTSEGMFLYGLASPLTGANNLVITFGSAYTFDYGIASYIGVVGTDGVFTSGNVTAGGATATETIVTTKDNAWMVAFVGLQRSTVAATGSILRSGNSSGGNLFDSGLPKTPAGSFSISQTEGTTGSNFNGLAVALYPTQSGGVNSGFFAFM